MTGHHSGQSTFTNQFPDPVAGFHMATPRVAQHHGADTRVGRQGLIEPLNVAVNYWARQDHRVIDNFRLHGRTCGVHKGQTGKPKYSSK